MVRAQNPNVALMEAAVAGLGPVSDQMVFLGGCAAGLLITDPAAPPIRATRDVDVIIEVASLAEYHRISGSLRDRGFHEDHAEQAPICRWTGHGVLLDVMPTDPEILGFGNEWYEHAFTAAQAHDLPSGRTIRLISAPYFLITKLAAFEWRGNGDYALSHDMEDLIAVIDGRPEVTQEVQQLDADARAHLARKIAALLANQTFVDSLPGHLPGDPGNQARLPILEARLQEMVEVQ